MLAQDPRCDEIIKPFLRGRDVKRWRLDSQDIWLVFTRRGIDIDDYPVVKRHLAAFRHQLEPKPLDWSDEKQGAWPGRKSGAYEWFHIQDNIAYWEEFLRPKIVIPAIAGEPIAAIDTHGHFSNNKTTIFIPPSSELASACVNSPVAAWFATQNFATKQGGFYDFEPRYSQQIPIPNTDAIQLTTICAGVFAVGIGHSKAEFERLLNGLVYELFFPDDLHAKNIRLFDACAAAGVGEGMDAAAIAAKIFHPSHTIYGMLFDLQSVEAVRIIEGLD